MAVVDGSTQPCDNCITQANAWIGCDQVMDGNPTGMVVWGEIPGVESITETIADSNATERRTSNTGGSFVLPSCASTNRTRTYEIVSQYCEDSHPRCFGDEGDVVYVRLYSDKTGTQPSGEFCEFVARLNYPAKVWDNTTDDPQLLNWSLEAIGPVLESGLANCSDLTPAGLLGDENGGPVNKSDTSVFTFPAITGNPGGGIGSRPITP